MKNIITISTPASILVLVLSCCFSNVYAQTGRNESAVETEQRASGDARRIARPRTNFIKMANFYLRNGEIVFGKLVSEDKNKITVEQLDGSRIVVSTYSKRELDARTLHTRNMHEANYYLELAEYFSGRTWDFKDDPDDFIQAIRCCEKARQTLDETQSRDRERIEQINEKMRQLQADRQVWIRETESRAKLKKLEFEAEIEARLKELEDKVNANNQQVNKTVEQLDKIIADMKDNHRKLEESITGIDKEISRQLDILEDQIRTNRRLIDRIGYNTWQYYPQPYYP